MRDGIIKETGNSRMIRGQFPATYDEFKRVAETSALPVDVLFNAEGWERVPTFLNKGTLLSDETVKNLGLLQEDPTVADALQKVTDLLGIKSEIKMEHGEYIGTGTSGESNQNSLDFNFTPLLLFVRPQSLCFDSTTGANPRTYAIASGFFAISGITAAESAIQDNAVNTSLGYVSIVFGENNVSWYASGDSIGTSNSGPITQCNMGNMKYYYIAIGI